MLGILPLAESGSKEHRSVEDGSDFGGSHRSAGSGNLVCHPALMGKLFRNG